MSQKLSHRLMIVGQIMGAIKVDIEGLLQQAQHKDWPNIHPRTPNRPVDILEQLRIQQGEQLVTKTVQKDPPPPLDTVKKAGVQLARPVRRASLALATSGVSEMLGATAGAVAGTLAAEADDQMQKFWDFEKSRRTAMTEFRATLEQFTRPENNGQDKTHVIFVIDELDRCRPDYAIELLEVIKHFFSVPHLHFVLGVNLSALEDMVRTRYGAKIDAQTYLGKFIQVTLELPDEITINRRQKQTILHYLDHLVYTMAIKDYIGNPLRDQVEVVARNNSVSLRDIGTIVSAIALASSEVTINPEYKDFFHGWIDVMNDLIIAKIIRPDLYPKMLDATITPDEILSYFGATENTVKGIYQYVVKSQL